MGNSSATGLEMDKYLDAEDVDTRMTLHCLPVVAMIAAIDPDKMASRIHSAGPVLGAFFFDLLF
jgi:hypothetical protein